MLLNLGQNKNMTMEDLLALCDHSNYCLQAIYIQPGDVEEGYVKFGVEDYKPNKEIKK